MTGAVTIISKHFKTKLIVRLCMGLIYISGLVLGLLSTVIALLGVAVLITYSSQNGVILLVMAFLGVLVCYINFICSARYWKMRL